MDMKRKALLYFEIDEDGMAKSEVRGYERDLKVGLLMLLEKVAKGTDQNLKNMLLEFLIVAENQEQIEKKEIKTKDQLKETKEKVIPINRDKKQNNRV